MLSDISEYSTERINAKEMDADTYVGVDNLLQNKAGKSRSSYVPLSGSLTKYNKGDVLIGNIRPYLKKIWFADNTGGTNGDVLDIHITSNLAFPKYLYHVLSSESFFTYDTAHSKGAKMPRGDKEAVMKYEFDLPSIDEQKRVTAILDRFDKLCNDISQGIPAEIEVRRKQYEHYRDTLLSFSVFSAGSTTI